MFQINGFLFYNFIEMKNSKNDFLIWLRDENTFIWYCIQTNNCYLQRCLPIGKTTLGLPVHSVEIKSDVMYTYVVI